MMKNSVSRRRFLGGALGISALTLVPPSVSAQTRKEHGVSPYIRCGRMTSVDLRKYYRQRV